MYLEAQTVSPNTSRKSPRTRDDGRRPIFLQRLSENWARERESREIKMRVSPPPFYNAVLCVLQTQPRSRDCDARFDSVVNQPVQNQPPLTDWQTTARDLQRSFYDSASESGTLHSTPIITRARVQPTRLLLRRVCRSRSSMQSSRLSKSRRHIIPFPPSLVID